MSPAVRASAALDRGGTARGFLCRGLGGVPAIALGTVAIMEVLGIEAELSTAEVRRDGIEPFIDAIRGSLDQLDAIPTHLLLTVGADAG
jgi:hypothetical protein